MCPQYRPLTWQNTMSFSFTGWYLHSPDLIHGATWIALLVYEIGWSRAILPYRVRTRRWT